MVMFFPRTAPALFEEAASHHALTFRPEDYHDGVAEEIGMALPEKLDRAVAKRKAEYLAGRLCAARAIQALTGRFPGALPASDTGGPAWPAGLRGSITHTHGFAAAVVASGAHCRSLGLDSEVCMSEETRARVAKSILNPEETMPSFWPHGPQYHATLVFSAKESLFKCLHPLVGEMFWFADASIHLSAAAPGRFTATLKKSLSPEFTSGFTVEGRYCLEGDLVHTGIMLSL
ncbi:4'-phosphopantetheinyl transferase family protein [Allorhizobium undicola]|uniref:4'-phosphopantetheinyl transferase family protein n=1 Tax=Allorhizobium undicola TaxID=78527 RepID=UPI0006876A2E|nr:4'-phosphopantetheinyl transferase superfamily protein [Allorhizobium undicola]